MPTSPVPAPLAVGFVILIGDPDQAALYQAKYPNGVQMSPDAAVVAFNAPYGTSPPAILVPWHGYNFDKSVASGSVHNQWTDNFGNFYPSNTFYWVGYFLCSLAAPPVVAPSNPVGVRRFIMGFEIPINGEGATQTNSRFSRDASRTPDGLGYAYRSEVSNGGPTMALPTPLTNFSYERFYVRLRKLPTAGNDMIWSIAGSVEGAGPGLHLDVSPAGALVLYNQGNAAAPGTVLVTSAGLTVGTWYRIDLNYQWAPAAAGNGTVQIWINGVSQGVFTVTRGTQGLGTVQNQNSSTIGNTKVASNGLECDIDDWINSSFLDTTTGSHVQVVRPTGLDSGSSAAWVGDWRQLLPNPANLAAVSDAVVSSTASSKLALTTDYQTAQLGCPAFEVCFRNNTSPAVNVQLGWRLGGVENLAVKAITTSTWISRLYTVSGTTIPAISSLGLVFVKDAAGGTIDANGFFAAAEFLGYFGQEDVVSPSTVIVPPPTRTGIHNAPYPSSAWAAGLMNTLSPVQVWSGVYTGNNLGQDVVTQFPAHWWWVRPLSGDTAGVTWWSSMVAAHGRLALAMAPIRMVQALLTSAFSGLMRIAGQDTQSNATGVTYQWVAISDPGMRFLINGAFAHESSLATAINALIDTGFTPEAAFLSIEQISSAATGMYFKGLGHTGADASKLDAAVTNNVITLGAGTITSQPNAVGGNSTSPQTAYSAWRRSDGGSPANCGGLGTVLFDLVTYTGDGTGNRSIACSLGNASPLFALVTPHNGASFFRDPSHPTTHSSQTNGVDSTTAIVGGDLNILKVGAALNALGITYDVFIVPGLAIPGGWSTNPSAPFTPVCPSSRPTNGPFPAPPAVNPTPVPTPAPVPTTIPTRGVCYPFSTFIADLATRLQDPGNVHWTSAELGRYIREALRTFQAYTQQYRQQGTFNTTVFQPFYDLPTVLPTLRGYTVTDYDLITDIQYALMEPPTPTAWSGSSQFTLADITGAIQRRLDLFLQNTGAVATRQILAITPDSTGRVTVPTNLIAIRRAAWIMNDATFTVVPLHREDEWALTNYARSWEANPASPTQTWPTGYSASVTPPLKLQIAPAPLAAGWLDLLAITLGNTVNPATGGVMGIPDDWTWVIKFGALSDLLGRDGTAFDPTRAAYCEARWKLGCDMAQEASVVLDGRVDNVPVRLRSLSEADFYKRGWQSESGTPSALLTTAQNLVAVSPPADANNGAGPYVVTLDVVSNMYVPTAGTDCVNVGLTDDNLDTILDYAEMLALFKEGPAQVQAAMDLYDRFVTSTGSNKRLDQAIFPNRGAVLQQSVQDERIMPRESPPEDTTS